MKGLQVVWGLLIARIIGWLLGEQRPPCDSYAVRIYYHTYKDKPGDHPTEWIYTNAAGEPLTIEEAWDYAHAYQRQSGLQWVGCAPGKRWHWCTHSPDGRATPVIFVSIERVGIRGT